MTISYTGDFLSLIFRWKGSLWKTIWRQLIVFLAIYYSINLIVRFALSDPYVEKFKLIQEFCRQAQARIPLLFLLGFYVFMMVSRWWSQFMVVSWPDRFMIFITSSVRGETERSRMCRRSIARWCNLMAVLCWRDMSLPLKKRFPTMEHIVKSGLMTDKELALVEKTPVTYGRWWLPAIWIANLLRKIQSEDLISHVDVKQLIKEIDVYRSGFGTLACYDWVSVPMVYTHVTTVATFGYFLCGLIADQIIPGKDLDTILPFVAILQFIFYIGWLKVGEDLMSPFGEDDDDFEMNWILERNINIGFMLADKLHGQLPKLEKDIYWNVNNPRLPHTVASSKVKENIFDGHLANVVFTEEEMEVIYPDNFPHDKTTTHVGTPPPSYMKPNGSAPKMNHAPSIELFESNAVMRHDPPRPPNKTSTPETNRHSKYWPAEAGDMTVDVGQNQSLLSPHDRTTATKRPHHLSRSSSDLMAENASRSHSSSSTSQYMPAPDLDDDAISWSEYGPQFSALSPPTRTPNHSTSSRRQPGMSPLHRSLMDIDAGAAARESAVPAGGSVIRDWCRRTALKAISMVPLAGTERLTSDVLEADDDGNDSVSPEDSNADYCSVATDDVRLESEGVYDNVVRRFR